MRFGLFHGLLGFGGFLGAGFGAFLFLLVENLLAAEKFEEGAVSAISLVPSQGKIAKLGLLSSPAHP